MSGLIYFEVVEGTNDKIAVNICRDTAKKLFDDAFESWCPACKDLHVFKGALICCNCLALATAYHHEHCGCLETSGRDEAR